MADQFLNKSGLSAFWAKVKAYIDAKDGELVTSGNWRYVIRSDNTFDAYYYGTGESFDIKYQSGNMYRSDPKQYTLPSALSSGTVVYFNGQIFHSGFPVWGAVSSLQPPKIQALSGANRGSVNLTVNLYVTGVVA